MEETVSFERLQFVASTAGRFNSHEKLRATHQIRRWMSPTCDLDALWKKTKRIALPGTKHRFLRRPALVIVTIRITLTRS